MIYSSVIDYYLEPKHAYYFLRRAYEPVLVCFERTADRIHVWVVNDSSQSVTGILAVERMSFDGKSQGKLQANVAVKPGEARRCLDTTELGEISLRSQFLHATFADRDVTCLLIGERYLHLPQAHLTVRRVDHRIEIATDAFARQVTLQFEGVTGGVFEDNFFDLVPRQKRTVAVIDAKDGRQLSVRALNAEPVQIAFKQ
jgi:beta-mannosidase